MILEQVSLQAPGSRHRNVKHQDKPRYGIKHQFSISSVRVLCHQVPTTQSSSIMHFLNTRYALLALCTSAVAMPSIVTNFTANSSPDPCLLLASSAAATLSADPTGMVFAVVWNWSIRHG